MRSWGPWRVPSRIAVDVLRQDQPDAAYGELGFKIVTATGGDVNARVVVRALEMPESVRLIENALRKLPAGQSARRTLSGHRPWRSNGTQRSAARGTVLLPGCGRERHAEPCAHPHAILC